MERNYQQTNRVIAAAALILAIAALIAAIVAIQNSNNDSVKLSAQEKKISELNKEVKLLDRPATSGAGAGPNSGTQTVGNQLPNGSGQ